MGDHRRSDPRRGLIEEPAHALSFLALNRHKTHLPPDVIAVFKLPHQCLIMRRVCFQPRDAGFHHATKPSAYLELMRIRSLAAHSSFPFCPAAAQAWFSRLRFFSHSRY